jgi:Spy/CpxP family protein refolding chaperone
MKLILILFMTLFAFSNSYSREGKGEMRKILQQLDLSEEQRSQLKEVRKDRPKQGQGDRQKMKELRGLMKAKFASDASEADLRNLHTQLKTMKVEKQEKRFNSLMKIRNILTLEQRVRFQELKPKRKRKRKD